MTVARSVEPFEEVAALDVDEAVAVGVGTGGRRRQRAVGPEGFAERFRAPGHVHLLRAAPDLLADRRGHTELGVALAEAAGVAPAVVVCEMLDEADGALSPTAARAYADRNGLVYVEGSDLLERFD